MLVCPQCQFENPNTNKFCQKCGTSLTHKVCHQCGSQVALNTERCSSCGAFTATVWWALISKDPNWQAERRNQPVVASQTQESQDRPNQLMTSTLETHGEPLRTESSLPETQMLQPPSVEDLAEQDSEPVFELDDPAQWNSPSLSENPADENSPATPEMSAAIEEATPFSEVTGSPQVAMQAFSSEDDSPDSLTTAAAVVYLDPQQRYQLLDPLPSLEGDFTEIQIRVMDCQPFQKSPLEALMEQGMPHEFVEPLTANSESDPSFNASSAVDALMTKTIPTNAKSYLALRSRFSHLPAIHDAWQQDETSVVLLEDRSEWPLLRDLWLNSSIPPLQILYWLDEMTKLWAALTAWGCRQSLLEVSNLRVDEDQSLSLQRLYPETNPSVNLQDLGQLWQTLFSQGQQTQFLALHQLFCELRDGKIETTDELRAHLEEIAQELNEPSTPYSADSGVTAMPREERELTPPLGAESPSGDDSPTIIPQPEGTAYPPDSSSSLTQKAPGEVAEAGEGDDMPTIILPMQLLSLDDAGGTDIGRQRHHNEDFFGVQTLARKQENPLGRIVTASGLYILCDGMGGHAGGEVASAMAVDTLRKYFQTHWQFKELPDESTIREAIRLANQAIYDVNQQNARSGSGRMGTTLVMVLVQDTKVAIAHVGDSRLYRLSRKRGLEQVTVDHEVGQREIQRGIDPGIAYSRPDAYQLTQALGPRDEHSVHPDIQYLELNEDTLLILCSDGLSDNDLLETHWQTHLLPLLSSRNSLDQGVNQLIDLANQHNGHDNITAVLIRAKVRPNLDQQRWT